MVARLVRAVEALVLLGMVVVSAVVMLEVVLRYGGGRSLIITEELSRYGMIWVAMLGAVLVLREESHISTGGLTSLGARGQRMVRVIADLLSLLFLVVMAVAGLQVLPGQLDQQTLTLGVTIFWFYLALPAGALLMALVIVARRLDLDHATPERPPASEI